MSDTGGTDWGIKGLGQATWGSHFCHLYEDTDDLLRLLVPYFLAGLKGHEVCVWVTSGPLGIEQARQALQRAMPDVDRALERQQLTIVPHTEWYFADGRFQAERALQRWVAAHDRALLNGFRGLRICGDPLWLEGREEWKDFAHYEQTVDQHIRHLRMLALCTYRLDRCHAGELLDIAHHHEVVLVNRRGEYEQFQRLAVQLGGRDLPQVRLTKREVEVLHWITAGKATADVGAILKISPRTVQKHLERIYQKLGVESRTAAALRGLELLGRTSALLPPAKA